MAGEPIAELHKGLQTLKAELVADELASKRVELACITFGPVSIATEFEVASVFEAPWLRAQGDTPMGAAITTGVELVRMRKEAYRANGIAFYRPWIFLLTDGAPTDEWKAAAALVKEGEASKAFAFFAVGVAGANMPILGQIAVREPLKLNGLRFRSLFQWLSNSMKSISRSTPGDEVPLKNPTEGPDGWASI
jgi:uncharacterized protein YegL